MQTVRPFSLLYPLLSFGALLLAGACGSSIGPDGNQTSHGPDGGVVGPGGDSGAIFVTPLNDSGETTATLPRCITATQQCVNACPGGGETTVTGTVYDPAEKNPLYGIVVYVPSTPPAPISTGASCYSCNSLYTGNPIAFAVTDSAGKFTIHGVPDGANIPLVVQVGKWRMQYTLPSVTACQPNDSGALLKAKLKLPNDHQVGDIPSIAISTGGADSLECLLHRIGVDEAEYGPGAASPGRIHIFFGDGGSNTAPAAPNAWESLWDTQADLMAYDITLLTCEGHETTARQRRCPHARDAAGALRLRAERWARLCVALPLQLVQRRAFRNAEPGDVADRRAALRHRSGRRHPARPCRAASRSRKASRCSEWMTNVNALTNDELHIVQARHNALVTAANKASLPWIETDTKANPPSQTEYFSFDTPFGVPPAEQCGRVVYSDLHVGAASGDYGGYTDNVPANSVVPTGCGDGDLSPQEKALEFMLFDLSGCVTPPDQGAGGMPPPK